MNRFSLVPPLILLTLLLSGCNFNENSLSDEQQSAIIKSIDFIDDSFFTAKERIDTDKIKIENTDDNTWKEVWNKGEPIDVNSIDLTDWIITIGDTSAHDFAIIVCDSSTSKVIGYIPID